MTNKEIDAEVSRILSMPDDELLAEAEADDVAWARAFKIGLRTGSHVRRISKGDFDMPQSVNVGFLGATSYAEYGREAWDEARFTMIERRILRLEMVLRRHGIEPESANLPMVHHE